MCGTASSWRANAAPAPALRLRTLAVPPRARRLSPAAAADRTWPGWTRDSHVSERALFKSGQVLDLSHTLCILYYNSY